MKTNVSEMKRKLVGMYPTLEEVKRGVKYSSRILFIRGCSDGDILVASQWDSFNSHAHCKDEQSYIKKIYELEKENRRDRKGIGHFDYSFFL